MLIALDTDAFNAITACFGMLKTTDAEKAARKAALQAATRHAIEVPFRVMEVSLATMDLAKAMAEIGNPNSVSDAGVGARAARAAVRGAYLNVHINCAGLADKAWVADILARAADLDRRAEAMEATRCASSARRSNRGRLAGAVPSGGATSAGGLVMGLVTPGPGTAYTKVGSVLGKTGFARYGDLVYVYLSADMKLAETVRAQLHHVMTVKRNVSDYTARFRTLASRYGLDLEGMWNKIELPHSGGHTLKYTQWVQDEVVAIDKIAGNDPEIFLREFNERIVVPLLRDPNKAYMK